MGSKVYAPRNFPEVFAEFGGNVTHLADHYGVSRQQIRSWRTDTVGQLTRTSLTASGKLTQGFKPTVPFIAPPTTEGWKPPKRPKVNASKPRTWALISDIHCPFHSEPLLAAFCAWLAEELPTDGIINGDLLDLPDVSKYAEKEDWVADVNKCLRSATYYLKSIIEASPKTRWRMIPGNHEKRLPDYIARLAPALWGIRPQGDEAFLRWHDLRNLLRLEELGIELHEQGYPEAEIALTPKFVVTHGDHTKKRSGNSAHAALDEADHSFAQGHDHRLAQVFRTKWGADKAASVHIGIQMGCMADVDVRGLGYAKKPDWQQGFAVVTTWPDGLFSAQLGVFVDGTLMIGDKRY